MTDAEIKKLIEKVADEAAKRTLNRLKEAGRVTYIFSNSFKKTEELLYLYPKLPDNHPEKKRIDKALKLIEDDDYCDVINMRYFEGKTINAISEFYDCKYQNISKHRNKLIKILASELFPEDVLKEILQK